MIKAYMRLQKMREVYIDTLSSLYDYSTSVYQKKQYTQWVDTKKGGYTYAEFKKTCDGIEVENFLLKAGFPYAIGYGLTETSPLIGYAVKRNRVVGSFGYPVYNVQLKLHDINPETGEGEIVAKGPNVMLGYYKDPLRTKSVFTEDGWFRTNDLAVQDKKGRFFIKGRKSNMILGASGENIYPEEIESVINNIEGVTESIVVERNGRLVALVQPIDGFIDWDKESEERILEKLAEWKSKVLKIVNRNVNKTSQVSSVEVMKEPFEKTATMKIRRFKYKDKAPTV